MVVAVHVDATSEIPDAVVHQWQRSAGSLLPEGTTPGAVARELDARRFAHSWSRVPFEGFPDYESVWLAFAEDYAQIERAVIARGCDILLIEECELCYVNVVTPEERWARRSHLERLFADRLRQCPYDTFLPSPDEVVSDTRFRIPGADGRPAGTLSVTVHSLAAEGGTTPMTGITLSARGRVKSATLGGVKAFFDVAFEWIVRGYASLASPLDHS